MLIFFIWVVVQLREEEKKINYSSSSTTYSYSRIEMHNMPKNRLLIISFSYSVYNHFRCNVTFQQQMLGFLYVIFLVLVVVVLSFKARGVRENYREAMYIGLTMGFTVCIFLVWILAGFIAPPHYQVRKWYSFLVYFPKKYKYIFTKGPSINDVIHLGRMGDLLKGDVTPHKPI